MNTTLAYSELTKRIYIVRGKEKVDVTELAEYFAFLKLKELPPEYIFPDQQVNKITKTIGVDGEQYEVTIRKTTPELEGDKV